MAGQHRHCTQHTHLHILELMSVKSAAGRVADPDPGSGSVLDPYSIGSVDPDPYSESGSGSGSRRAKITHKSRQ